MKVLRIGAVDAAAAGGRGAGDDWGEGGGEVRR